MHDLAPHEDQSDMALDVRSKVLRLEQEARKLPQVQLTTRHYFADGMYARELSRPAGTLIVGKTHKREHFYMVTHGAVAVVGDRGTEIYRALSILVSKPGTKRAVLALEDSVCVTIHRTDLTDLDEIEKVLIEPEEAALFDARNELKIKELI